MCLSVCLCVVCVYLCMRVSVCAWHTTIHVGAILSSYVGPKW